MNSDLWSLPEELRALADGGDDDLVKEVLSVFQSDTEDRVKTMRAACGTGDREELRKQAHALKGSSAQVGALAMAKLCQTLETTARTADAAELERLVGEIDREFGEVRAQMQT